MMRNELMLWRNPISLLDSFRHEMEAFVNRVFDGREWAGTLEAPMWTGYSPMIESYVDGKTLHLKADLPGVEPKDVEIVVEGRQLTLKGERKAEQETQNGNYFHREVRYGRFARTFLLPEGVKAEDIQATYRNGVLEIAMPLPESLVAKQIPVQTASEEEPRQLAA
jgi:HSP20 family protein